MCLIMHSFLLALVQVLVFFYIISELLLNFYDFRNINIIFIKQYNILNNFFILISISIYITLKLLFNYLIIITFNYIDSMYLLNYLQRERQDCSSTYKSFWLFSSSTLLISSQHMKPSKAHSFGIYMKKCPLSSPKCYME